MSKSRLHKFNPDYTWSEVAREAYKQGEAGQPVFCGIDRQTLIGLKGESAKFHVRYFEVEPGGHSSLEKHEHEHAVICVRGAGRALAGDKVFDVGFMDALYVAPNEPHQLINPGTEPFGFICIVDAERDRPKELSDYELKSLDESEETRGKFIGYIQGD